MSMFQTLWEQIILTLETKKEEKGNFQTFYFHSRENLTIMFEQNLNMGEYSKENNNRFRKKQSGF